MNYPFKLIDYDETNRVMTVQLFESLDLERLSTVHSGDLSNVNGGVIIPDPRRFSEQQRKLYWSLMRDIYLWSGTSETQLSDYFKAKYIMKYYKQISLSDASDASVTEVNNLIEIVLDFMFEWNVPFPKSYELLPRDQQYYFYQCCKHRKCVVCGQSHADIHHLVAVGNRKRDQVDHRKLPLTALCRRHHTIIHTLGLSEFMKRFEIHPVYLGDDDLVAIGIMNKNQIMNLDDTSDRKTVDWHSYEKNKSGRGPVNGHIQANPHDCLER